MEAKLDSSANIVDSVS